MKKNRRLFYLVLIVCVLPILTVFMIVSSNQSYGQTVDTADKTEMPQEVPADHVNPLPGPDDIEAGRRYISELEFFNSLLVMVVGLVIIIAAIVLIWAKNYDKDTALKLIIVTFIVTATLFLITAGFSNNQIAPAIGLLGTIAGYLLGKSNQPQPQPKPDQET